MNTEKKIGLALGSGGAKGLAHIPLLEVLDEYGIRPYCIAGTSIGAILGVLYASGISGREIRQATLQYSFHRNEGMPDLSQLGNRLLKWFDSIDINWGGHALLRADTFLENLMKHTSGSTFEELDTSLRVVASDFWKREQVVFDSGPLLPAIHASMALPGVFKPVVVGDRVLVDGGAVNPVPFDLLQDCDFTIAVNVMGNRTEGKKLVPSMSEAIFNTFQIMQHSILEQKLARKAPDIYIAPEVRDIQMLEFYRAEEIFAQARNAGDLLRSRLDELLA